MNSFNNDNNGWKEPDFQNEEEGRFIPRRESLPEELFYSKINERDKSGPKKGRRKGLLAAALAGALLGSGITMGITYAFLPDILASRGINFGGSQQEIIIEPTQDLTVYSAVAKKVMPSVVGITTVQLQRDWFFGMRKQAGVGTGVIVDERGYILTNSHVIGDGNAEEVTVLFYDGKKLAAEILWHERSLDLAIIKVEGGKFPVAELGDSDVSEVGEIAIAIGNPLGLNFERTLTQGVVSGLNRTITIDASGETIENLIQTDASINPGNSGGPLLNVKGQVIGINTAKGAGEGLGFAIPINIAKPIVEQFIENGQFQRVYLGIQGVEIEVFEAITGTKLQAEEGIYVAEVVNNSVAHKYDIRPGDVIIQIGDEEVKRMSNLIRALYRYRPGNRTTVTILRNGQENKIDIVF